MFRGVYFPDRRMIEKLKFACDMYLQEHPNHRIEELNNLVEKELERTQNIYQTNKVINKTKNIKSKPGHIYFLQDEIGRIKIGKTRNLKNRIFDIGIKLPAEPQLLHSIKTEDITSCERYFHSKYQEYRLNGEWFNLPKQELNRIKEVEVW